MSVLKGRFGLPAKAALILGLVGGLAQVLNYVVVPASSRLHGEIAVALQLLVGAGIPPLVGPSFKAALHLSPKVSYAITVVLAIATIVLTSASLSVGLMGVLAVAITVVQAFGFSTALLPLGQQLATGGPVPPPLGTTSGGVSGGVTSPPSPPESAPKP